MSATMGSSGASPAFVPQTPPTQTNNPAAVASAATPSTASSLASPSTASGLLMTGSGLGSVANIAAQGSHVPVTMIYVGMGLLGLIALAAIMKE